jgi:tRNA pseudouridine38-40 synthase
MVIISCEEVHLKFHARYDVKSKTYQYRILNRNLPIAIQRQYVWHIRRRLDTGAMRQASNHLVGRHNFKAFEGAGSPRSHSKRQVFKVDIIRKNEDYLIFEIEADGFLRFMVRNIIGTLVEVGRGKISSGDFKDILLSKDRSRAGATAPAQGLFLIEVKY